jgi:hypothetical protein
MASLCARLNEIENEYDREWMRACVEGLEQRPQLIWRIADSKYAETLLADQSWDAVLNLTDKDAVARLNGDDAAALEVSRKITRQMGIGDPDEHRMWWRARRGGGYDESEHPRDELGRWTESGDGGGGAADEPPKDEVHVAGHIERTVRSMQNFAKESQGTLRERVVIMQRETGKVLADIEQELMIGGNFEHVPTPTSGFTDADLFDEKREFHPDGSILSLHTHPLDQTFSDGDWRVFMRHTIGEMRVVAPNGEYTLIKTKEFTDRPWQERTPAAMNTAYNKHLDAVFDEFYKAGKDQDHNALLEEVTQRVAKEFDVEYSFRPLTGDGSKADKDHPGEGYSAGAFVKNGVIHTNDVNDAAKALGENRKVELAQPRQLSILLDKLGDIAKDMIAKGEKAPKFDLCNVTISGTNLFCVQSKGIPRVEMPQLAKQQDVEFFKYLEAQGYKVKYEQQYASYLHATQNQLDGVKVAGIAQMMRDRDYKSNPIFVSNDDYILDGHHRWAAEVGNDARNNVLGDSKMMDIARVNISITKLLEEANKFTEGKGKLAHGESRERSWAWALARWQAEQTLARLFGLWDESEHPRDDAGKFAESGGGGGSSQSIESFAKDGIKLHINFEHQEKFIKTWNNKIGQTPAEFRKNLLGGIKSTMEIAYDGKEMMFAGSLLDETGKEIGGYKRTIDFKANTAKANVLGLDESVQGTGLTKKILSANIDTYQKLGLDMVETHANIEVGGYAWARYGYVPTKISWKNLQVTLKRKIDELSSGGKMPPDEANALLKLVNGKDPRAMWQIADSKWGDDILLEESWTGEIRFSDKDTMARFKAYIGKK